MQKTLALNNFWNLDFLQAKRPAVMSKKAARLKPALWKKAAALSLTALALFLTVSYMISANSYAASGYEIKKLKTQLSELSETNQKLNVQTARASSMLSVQTQLQNSGYVPAGTPQFLRVNQLSQR